MRGVRISTIPHPHVFRHFQAFASSREMCQEFIELHKLHAVRQFEPASIFCIEYRVGRVAVSDIRGAEDIEAVCDVGSNRIAVRPLSERPLHRAFLVNVLRLLKTIEPSLLSVSVP